MRKCLFRGAFTEPRNSVYPAVLRNDNHCSRRTTSGRRFADRSWRLPRHGVSPRRADGSAGPPEGGPHWRSDTDDLEDVSGIPDYSGCRELMTGADGRSVQQRQPTAAARAADDQDKMNFGIWGFRAPGTMCTGRGTRASANTSGSDFTRTKTVGEIADLKIHTVRRKTVSSAGPVFDGASPSKLRSGRLT
jgi:hypothetical protein